MQVILVFIYLLFFVLGASQYRYISGSSIRGNVGDGHISAFRGILILGIEIAPPGPQLYISSLSLLINNPTISNSSHHDDDINRQMRTVSRQSLAILGLCKSCFTLTQHIGLDTDRPISSCILKTISVNHVVPPNSTLEPRACPQANASCSHPGIQCIQLHQSQGRSSTTQSASQWQVRWPHYTAL